MRGTNRGLLPALLIVAVIAAGLAVAAGGGPGKHNDKGFEYQIGLWGDLPYNDVQAQSGVPNLIGVGAILVLTIAATSSWFVLFNRVKRTAGRALGLSARDSRRLDVGSPELLSASLARIRGEQGH